ncbi:hypothetical protein [Tenacibaculum caenipelagi]|uniref:JAB domain-containing protein n=1 Tax=Tenacibaculum caenipelagi TaxID=1325435 RepID=A0A4R6TK38_9FLAO|nr:hypothetical protein [Tenacibaculum caenipelagi]TDQ28601.1 hypothetical protein DFQ07_0978 [Tenacibaculum caenipelagi]
MTQEEFDKLVEQSQPHKVFNTEWNKYYSLQFADTFLPQVGGYQGKGMQIYDGANLFGKIRKTERKLQPLTNDDKLISIIGYTFPEGVLASEKKNLVKPAAHEVCFFAEVTQKDTVNLTFTYGENFKEFLKELSPKKESINTTVQEIRTHFNNTITHENTTEFVLKSLGVEKEAITKANYNQSFSKKVLNYLEEAEINGKYKVQIFIKKTQKEAGLESGDLDFKKVKVFEPLPNEVFIWLVSEDNINFDTSFIKIKIGTGIANDLKEKQTTIKEFVGYLSNLIKEEVESQTFSNSKIKKAVEKGLFIPIFKLHTQEKTKNNPIAKEILETNPVAFLAVEGIDYITQGIEKFKVADNVWNPQLQPYTPIFPGKLENAFFCGLFNGAVQAFKELPEMATFIIKMFNSETESKQFVEGVKKLFTDVEVIKAIANKAIEGYKEGVYTKNTEKVVYQLGYDTIKIVSFFIGAVQFAKTVGNLVSFTKKGLLYLKKYGKKGINKLKKLKPDARKKIFEKLIREDDLTKRIKGYSSKFAKKVSKHLDEAPNQITQFEGLHITSKEEFGKVYNPITKKAEVHTSNLPDRIIWPNRITNNLRGYILTHNHPGGTGLSIADIDFFVKTKLKEIRAVTPEGEVFSLRWNKNVKIKEIQAITSKIEEIQDDFSLLRLISVGDEAVSIKREFEAIFKALEDKIIYIHYVNK